MMGDDFFDEDIVAAFPPRVPLYAVYASSDGTRFSVPVLWITVTRAGVVSYHDYAADGSGDAACCTTVNNFVELSLSPIIPQNVTAIRTEGEH